LPDREPDEKRGECLLSASSIRALVLGTVGTSEFRRLRVNLGINPEGFTWQLDPASAGVYASTFHSPEIVQSCSNTGTGGLSRQWHRLFRERLVTRARRCKISYRATQHLGGCSF
jgi:alpha-galactosidase